VQLDHAIKKVSLNIHYIVLTNYEGVIKMVHQMVLEVEDSLYNYIQRESQQSLHSEAQEFARNLLKKGAVIQLYQKYNQGELTLRGIAEELGITYRELYALLEEIRLPF